MLSCGRFECWPTGAARPAQVPSARRIRQTIDSVRHHRWFAVEKKRMSRAGRNNVSTNVGGFPDESCCGGQVRC